MEAGRENHFRTQNEGAARKRIGGEQTMKHAVRMDVSSRISSAKKESNKLPAVILVEILLAYGNLCMNISVEITNLN